jgi:signal transduction histidine kinase
MNNIAKHAKASHALIQLIEHEDTVVMIVEDNGIGLVVGTGIQSETHGLAAIQSKIHYLNGTFSLDAADPHGLIITIEIPKETHDKNYSG